MPTRHQVLEAGPVNVQPGARCAICSCTLIESRNPIRLPCQNSHVFCKACIEPWLHHFFICFHLCAVKPWCDDSPQGSAGQQHTCAYSPREIDAIRSAIGISRQPQSRADRVLRDIHHSQAVLVRETQLLEIEEARVETFWRAREALWRAEEARHEAEHCHTRQMGPPRRTDPQDAVADDMDDFMRRFLTNSEYDSD